MLCVTDQTIKVGDTVTLIIGGPQMLVEVLDADDLAYCVWFNQCGELQKDRFHINSLQVVEKGDDTT